MEFDTKFDLICDQMEFRLVAKKVTINTMIISQILAANENYEILNMNTVHFC